MADDAVKQEGAAETLSLTVRDQNQGEVQFKVKKTTKFAKIIGAFAQKKALDKGAFRLLFDGQRLDGDRCPEDLDMEDGDIIDAVLEQTGGSR